MVRAMTRVASRENEDHLRMIARHGTASHMERLGGAVVVLGERKRPVHWKRLQRAS